ncbi:MAG TPA: type II toxin-antitoxin system HicA family toxin [Nevskiales bacterium]|nr:type II toxin-antitoxin system HicA family toxin [Nevskiales bacterium]
MSNWPSAKAKRVLAALLHIGWRIKRQSGSHKTLSREGWLDKVTLSLSRRSVDFFKAAARRNHTSYQRMIRRLLDRYADRYAGGQAAPRSRGRARATRRPT